MLTAFTPSAWEDYQYWQGADPQMLERINELIREISRDPFRGKGKPEPLRGNLAGYWSRRLSGEHRLVYRVTGADPHKILVIIQVRFHY